MDRGASAASKAVDAKSPEEAEEASEAPPPEPQVPDEEIMALFPPEMRGEPEALAEGFDAARHVFESMDETVSEEVLTAQVANAERGVDINNRLLADAVLGDYGSFSTGVDKLAGVEERLQLCIAEIGAGRKSLRKAEQEVVQGGIQVLHKLRQKKLYTEVTVLLLRLKQLLNYERQCVKAMEKKDFARMITSAERYMASVPEFKGIPALESSTLAVQEVVDSLDSMLEETVAELTRSFDGKVYRNLLEAYEIKHMLGMMGDTVQRNFVDMIVTTAFGTLHSLNPTAVPAPQPRELSPQEKKKNQFIDLAKQMKSSDCFESSMKLYSDLAAMMSTMFAFMSWHEQAKLEVVQFHAMEAMGVPVTDRTSAHEQALLKWVNTVKFFKDNAASEAQQTEVCKTVQAVAFTNGEDIVRQGDRGDAFFAILSGEVNIFVNGNNVGHLAAGFCFGDRALEGEAETRSATVRAVGQVTCARLSADAYHACIERVTKAAVGEAGEAVAGDEDVEDEDEITVDVRAMFDQLDEDGSGVLDFVQIRKLMVELFPEMTEDEQIAAFDVIDDDNSGEVEYDEFAVWWEQQQLKAGSEMEERMRQVQARLNSSKARVCPKAYDDVGEMLDSARGVVFQSILEVLSDYVENVRIASMKAEQFLAFIAGTRKFIEIGQAFGMMSKTALVGVYSRVDHKCELFWQEYHGNNMMTLRNYIDSEMWLIPEGIRADALDIDAAHITLPADLCCETPKSYKELLSSKADDPFKLYTTGVGGRDKRERVVTADAAEARPGAYTRTSLLLISYFATYSHMVQILHNMADNVVQGVAELLELYTHSIYKICGTTATASADYGGGGGAAGPTKGGETKKKGMKAKMKSKGSVLKDSLPEHQTERASAELTDIRQFPNLAPGVHALVDDMCKRFDTDDENFLWPNIEWGERCKVDMWDGSTLHALVYRALAIESLMALGAFLETHRSRFVLPESLNAEVDITKSVAKMYNAIVDELPNLRTVLYEFVACLLFDMDDYVKLLEKTNWELKDLGSDESAYMNRMVKALRYLNTQVERVKTPSEDQDAAARMSAEQGAVVVTDSVLELLWRGLINKLMHRMVDGICRIERFTQEGLALMNLDFQVLEQELKQLTTIRPIPETEFSNGFVKAYYITSEDDILAWVKEHKEYSAEHCRGLVMHGVGASLKKKARKDLEEKVDQLLRFRS